MQSRTEFLRAYPYRRWVVQMGTQAKGRLVTLLLIGFLAFNFVVAAWRVIHDLSAPPNELTPGVVGAPLQDDIS